MTTATEITILTADQIKAARADFIELLTDAVDNGASVGFIAPLAYQIAENYWMRIERQVEVGQRIVIAALAGDRVAGSVQLGLDEPLNGLHRAELQKLFIHRDFRRQGLATRLLTAAETAAQDRGRTLLVLDTERGSGAESLYEKSGYVRAGIIPEYALNHEGKVLIDTVVFYKRL
jgi:ribosomal protein S18 acetylase RimI-like enzyme